MTWDDAVAEINIVGVWRRHLSGGQRTGSRRRRRVRIGAPDPSLTPVAVNHRTRQGEEWVDVEPSFYDVTLWEKLAENAAESLRKGDRILVTGQMHTEAWTDSDGAKRTRQVITDTEIGASLRFTTVQVARGTREQPASPN